MKSLVPPPPETVTWKNIAELALSGTCGPFVADAGEAASSARAVRPR